MNEMARIVSATSEEVRTRITTAEFFHMDECGAFDDLKVELVDGELQFMQKPLNNHAMRQAQVVIRLAAVVGEPRVRGELALDLGEDTVLVCDAAVLFASVDGHRLVRADELALLVEVSVTTRKRDLGMKRLKYASAGIEAYWVVDAEHEVVQVHTRPVDGDYLDVRSVRFGEPIAVPGSDATITLT
jgi:Uma2 family endonuclease